MVRTNPATDTSGQPYVVRARDRESLAALFPEKKVIETPLGDYRWRVFVNLDCLLAAVLCAVRDIDYTNFKDEVHGTSSGNLKRDMEFGLLCQHVWFDGVEFQDQVAKAPTTRPAQTEDYRSRKKPAKGKKKRP